MDFFDFKPEPQGIVPVFVPIEGLPGESKDETQLPDMGLIALGDIKGEARDDSASPMEFPLDGIPGESKDDDGWNGTALGDIKGEARDDSASPMEFPLDGIPGESKDDELTEWNGIAHGDIIGEAREGMAPDQRVSELDAEDVTGVWGSDGASFEDTLFV